MSGAAAACKVDCVHMLCSSRVCMHVCAPSWFAAHMMRPFQQKSVLCVKIVCLSGCSECCTCYSHSAYATAFRGRCSRADFVCYSFVGG